MLRGLGVVLCVLCVKNFFNGQSAEVHAEGAEYFFKLTHQINKDLAEFNFDTFCASLSLAVPPLSLNGPATDRGTLCVTTPCSKTNRPEDRSSLVHQAREMLSYQRGQSSLAVADIDYGTDAENPEYQLTRKSQVSSIVANFQIDEVDEAANVLE